MHLLQGGVIVGQMELGSFKTDPSIGYVNLYYLAAEVRGTGLSSVLDNYATNYFVSRGFTSARLSVSPSNSRAIRFYEKHGWHDLGPRPGRPEVHLMEKYFQ